MRTLLLREIAETKRNIRLPLGELREAQAELERASAEDDEVRHLLRIPDASPWMRYWVGEVEPTLAYARHLELADNAQVQLLDGQSGRDVVVECSVGAFEAIEITGTYNYHDRLTGEILNAVGWVASTTPKTRNSTTREAEYAEEDSMDSADDIIADWVQRIETTLRKKQRPNYGSGSTLLVSCRGLSGDLAFIRPNHTIDDVVKLIARDVRANGFDRTIVMSWHKGWIAQL